MANLKFDINVKEIAEQFQDLKKEVEKEVTEGARNLSVMTHAKLHELARDNLRSLRKIYQDNIEYLNPEPNLWIVNLKESAMWIEEDRKSGSMVDDLLKNNAKTSKEGKKYKAIPFEHSKNPTEQSSKAQELTNQIKMELKKQNINWRKIEYNKDGSPRLGRLHTLNIQSARPQGQLTPLSKTPALQGVTIYQSKDAGGKVRRDVLTFRIVSEKHKEEGRWVHPGRQGNKLMDETFAWALQTWEKDILPNILSQYK